MDKTPAISVLEACRHWVEKVVVGLGLCPFAAVPLQQERVRFALCAETELEGMLQALAEEMAWLESADGPQTTLLVIPRGVEDFDRFLDLVGAAEALLTALGKDGVFQLAHFHPAYCFEGRQPDDPENLTNRSPHPVLHLLCWSDVAEAVTGHPDPAQIPEQNMARMRSLGLEGLRRLLSEP
jgi:hypothetical protein